VEVPLKLKLVVDPLVKTPELFTVPVMVVKVEFVLMNELLNPVLADKVKVPLIYPFGAFEKVMIVELPPVEPTFRELPASMAKSFPLPPAMVKV
jgi:hypothetical protein